MAQQGLVHAWHPFTDFTNYKHNEWEMVCKCRGFLEATSLEDGNCKSLNKNKTLKCKCLKNLDKSISRDAIVPYMVVFFNKSMITQQFTIMDWMRYASSQERQMFYVPFLNPCKQGEKFDNSEISEDLVEFFDEVSKLGQSQSIRIMQVKTGIGLHDGEDCGADTCLSEPCLKRYFLNKKLDSKVVLAEPKTREVCKQNNVYAPLVMEPETALSENNQILTEGSLHLPNLGATQPKETYYMTPLMVSILGIVDCSLLEGGSLDVFAYHKGIGDEIGGELTVLMDNCDGQNKNNHVLHLANLFVEAGYFKKVNFMFYVIEHTKNCADCWFNTMKRDYQNQNLYTFDQLCKALGTNEQITIHPVTDGDFKHYKWLEDLFYKELKTGTIQPGYIFTVESDAPNTMKIWQDSLGMADVSVQDLRKQIELYTKWWKLVVPAEFVDIICPYPGDEVMRKFKEERNRKARK
eukprot:jgi/Psemu1/26139/gm1.26139_g